jgi:hypothetical protein
LPKGEINGGKWNHQNSALNQNQGKTPSDLHQKLFTPQKNHEKTEHENKTSRINSTPPQT